MKFVCNETSNPLYHFMRYSSSYINGRDRQDCIHNPIITNLSNSVLGRNNYNSNSLLKVCKKGETVQIEGLLAAHSITTKFYFVVQI